jgi:hypothetical protein
MPRQTGWPAPVTDTGGGSSLTIALPASGWKRIGNTERPEGLQVQRRGHRADDPCKLVMVRDREIKFICIGRRRDARNAVRAAAPRSS